MVADVYNNIQKWNSLHIKGASIVKEIASVKSSDPKVLSSHLEELTDELYDIVQRIRYHKDALETFVGQITALQKLDKEQVPLFISLDIISLTNLFMAIAIAYSKEFNVS